MKHSRKMVLGFLIVVQTSFASDVVSTCHYTVNNNENGKFLTHGYGYIRLGHDDKIEVNDRNSAIQSLSLNLSEVQISPDSFDYSLTGSIVSDSSRTFFNPNGTIGIGATFGDKTNFGLLECELPKKIPYYFVRNAQEVLLLNKIYQGQKLYSILTNPATCVSGDLKQAALALEGEWTLPIQNLRATSSGLEWNEAITRCLESVPSDDHPGEDCVRSEVTNNGPKAIPLCK